jgi:hypothetical protein
MLNPAATTARAGGRMLVDRQPARLPPHSPRGRSRGDGGGDGHAR